MSNDDIGKIKIYQNKNKKFSRYRSYQNKILKIRS